MSKPFKIKEFMVRRNDGQTFYSSSLDEAMRLSQLHDAKGRLTKEQALQRCAKHGADIFVLDSKNTMHSLSDYMDDSCQETTQTATSNPDNPTSMESLTGQLPLSKAEIASDLSDKQQQLSDSQADLLSAQQAKEERQRKFDDLKRKIDAIKEKGLEDTLEDLMKELLMALKHATEECALAKDLEKSIQERTDDLEKQCQDLKDLLDKPDEATATAVEVGKDKRKHHMFNELLARCRAVKSAQGVEQDALYPMLVGPAGSGKTTASRLIAQELFGDDWRDKYAMLSMNEESERSEGFGFISPIDKVYKSTDFRKMYEHGGVFLLDEMDASNPNALTALNAAISSPMAAFPDKVVDRHPDFVLIAAANTFGDGADGLYVGRNPLDGATLDRFQTIYWDYDWEGVRLARPSHTAFVNLVELLSKTASKLAMEIIISPRAALFGPFLFAEGLSVRQVLDSLVFKGLDKNDVQTLCNNANINLDSLS